MCINVICPSEWHSLRSDKLEVLNSCVRHCPHQEMAVDTPCPNPVK